MSDKQQAMLDEMKVAIYRALDQEGDTEKRVSLALNAMAFASGIASAIMEEGGRGKISAASLLSAVLQSEIVSGGIDRYAKHGRPQNQTQTHPTQGWERCRGTSRRAFIAETVRMICPPPIFSTKPHRPSVCWVCLGGVVAWADPKELAALKDPLSPAVSLRIWGHRAWSNLVPLFARSALKGRDGLE